MFKSDIEYLFLDKKQDNGSKHTSVWIFLFCEVLLLLIVPYPYDTSTLGDSVAFAQSDSNTSIIGSSTNTTLKDRSPSFLEAYWTDNSGSTSTSSTSASNNNDSIRKEVGPGEGAS